MNRPAIETDYLVIGAGVSALAFVDTLIQHSDADVTVVDRHGKPGGHWNDAYPFVTLHQPSAFYGVNSLELGSGTKDMIGLNRGMAELASGAEVCGYLDRVMNRRLLPSGRVRYFPLCEQLGDGSFRSLLSGARTPVSVRRRVVDAAFCSPTVPSTHVPGFRVEAGVRLVPPNALPGLWQDAGQNPAPRHFTVIGAGKTAMDTCIWLLQTGAPADAISWVVPRDSWVVDRLTTQNGPEFFDAAIGGVADQMEACATATSIDELFLKQEAAGILLRIDPDHLPTMFHYATLSQAEAALLRQVRHVIRLGHVQALEAGRMVLDHGEVPALPDALYIDCTASALRIRPPQPVFQDGRITPQVLRMPQPAFSAALTAYVETHFDDDTVRNRLCRPVPFPKTLADFPAATMGNLLNQMQWMQDPGLRDWIRTSRLDSFGKLVAGADRQDARVQATLARLRTQTVAAMENLPRLAKADPQVATPSRNRPAG